MEELFEKLLKMQLGGMVRSQVLAIVLRGLEGVRRLVIVHHLMMVAGMLCALSLFGAGYHLATSWSSLSWHALPQGLVYCGAVFFVTALLLVYTCRSQTWVSAFGVQAQLEAALRSHSGAPDSGVDVDQLAALVGRILEQKLAAAGVAPKVTEPVKPELQGEGMA